MKRIVALLLIMSVCFGLMGTTVLGAETKFMVVSKTGITYGNEKLPDTCTGFYYGYSDDDQQGMFNITNSVLNNYADVLENYDIYLEMGLKPVVVYGDQPQTPLVILDSEKYPHTHDVDPATVKPTDDGTQHSGTCTTCGQAVEEGHKPSETWEKNGTNHWKVCSVCKTHVDEAEHDFKTGVCPVCGEVEEGTVPVKFDANGGTFAKAEDAEQQVKYGGTVTKPSDPSRDGYKFTFWSDTKVNGKEYDFKTQVFKNTELILYAQWTEEQTGPSDKPIVPPAADDKGGVDEDKFTDNSGSLTEDDKTTIKGSEISVGTEDKDAANKLATEAAKDQKAVDQALADLQKIPGYENLTQKDIEFVAKPVLTIKVEKLDAGNKVVVMDINGMIQVYACTKDGKAEVPVNGKSQALTKAVTIVVGLPSIFHNEQHVYVGHKDYQYKAANKGSGKFSFINRHGFSSFEFGLQDKAVASNSAYADEFEYLNFKTAASEANSGETLTIKKDCSEDLRLKDGVKVTLADNVKFTGKINGKDVELSAGSVYTVGGSTTDKTGGSGGGSSKPSIKPGTTTTPTDPITNPEDQTGTVAGFSDVAASAWYADAVKYVVDRGLFGGVGNGRFAPDANMTRAMMWTVLARYKGVDTNTGSNWYEAARTWAMQQNISDGTMADGNVTREQFVTMLWRLSGEPAANNSASFTDNGRVSAYAKTAVDWAVAQGIVNGYNDGSFRPQGSATRAEVAKMLMVFCVTSEG